MEVLRTYMKKYKTQAHEMTVFRCHCGKVGSSRTVDMKKTKSCGCLAGNHQHGMRGHRMYPSWVMMKQRCYNPANKDYNHYGGRGVRVCKAWKNSFYAFYKWIGERPKDMTLDRIDVDGNYEPFNVRWASAEIQVNNRRV